MNALITVIKKGFGWSGVLVWIGLVFIGYSVYLPQNTSVLVILATIVFPFVSFLGFFLLLITALAREWKLLIIQGVFLLICIPPLTKTFALNPGHSEPTENSIKVMSYNVLGFNHEMGKPDGTLQFILEEDPDIICLQEFSDRPEEFGYSLEQLTEKLKNYPYVHFEPHHETRYHSKIGICIFSKFPIQKTQAISYESRVNSSCLYELNIQGKKLILVNNHLESIGLSTMDFQIIMRYITSLRSDLYPIVQEIMSDKVQRATMERMHQAELIQKALVENQGDYVMICGDLNDTPLSPTLLSLKENLKDAFIEAGTGMGSTHQFLKSGLRIDYFLHSKSMIPYNFRIEKLPYSDHFPILCSFTLK